ncbi:MAG TPA: hypothetical protein VN947_08180 [Polyangia bacterium]|nr:hypothetical protein [Polyangia bacterium]
MRRLLLRGLATAAACGSASSSAPDLAAPDDLAQPIYTCMRPLADYCGRADFGDVSATDACLPIDEIVARLCPPDAGLPPVHARAFLADCGDYQSVLIGYVDTSTSSYYDKATGALVAVIGHGNFSDGCDAGPATFLVPSCQPAVTLCP